MWLISKIKQVLMVMKPGIVTLKYPFEPHPVPAEFRGQPEWDHHKCIGCGGCAAHCPARTIMIRDVCQELRIMLYDSSRCTYCGRCSDVCPESAISMSEKFENATEDKKDNTVSLELFMLTCHRCGRCYNHEKTNVIDMMEIRGYRYDSLEYRAVIPMVSEQLNETYLKRTENYQRPKK